MSIPTEGQASDGVVAAPVQPGPAVKDVHDHWPLCRCGHPMHPHRVELRRGVRMERFKCPRRRWWNPWFHPNAWQPARE